MSKTNSLAKALLQFQKSVGTVHKDKEAKVNANFSYKYATLGALQEAIREPLALAGIIVRQMPTAEGLETTVCHVDSGECETFITPLIFAQQSSQAFGSAVTYARRYALGSYFNLIVDEDDDGKAASKQPRSDQSQQAKKPMTEGQYNALSRDIAESNLARAEKAIEYYADMPEAQRGKWYAEFIADYTAAKMDAE